MILSILGMFERIMFGHVVNTAEVEKAGRPQLGWRRESVCVFRVSSARQGVDDTRAYMPLGGPGRQE